MLLPPAVTLMPMALPDMPRALRRDVRYALLMLMLLMPPPRCHTRPAAICAMPIAAATPLPVMPAIRRHVPRFHFAAAPCRQRADARCHAA